MEAKEKQKREEKNKLIYSHHNILMASLATGTSRNPHGRTAAQRRKTTEEGRCVKRDIVFSKELFDKS